MLADVPQWISSVRRASASRHGTAVCIGLILAGLAMPLGGCSQSLAEAKLQGSDITGAIAKGEMRSPKPAAVAFSSIEGAPDDLVTRFKQGMTAEAGLRQITVTDPALARYFVRGYLAAFPTDKGTSVRCVWDVYDSTKRRVERLDDELDLPGSDGDPWASVDDKVLADMAARSADVIAAFLATTPEAAGSTIEIVSAAVPAAVTPPRAN